MLRSLATACLLLSSSSAQKAPPTEPRNGVVPLPAAEGWEASLVLDRGDIGIWTVKSFQVFPQYGTPEVVGLDDKGRCWILVHYSGKWTPMSTIEEGEWLGGLDHGDVDPRAPGAELYTGGKKGNLYQVRAYPFGATDHRLIARFPGEEVHTLLAGDLDPRTEGSELLVFTAPGALYRVTPTGANGEFETTKLCDTPGRVRDALVLPRREGESSARVATVSRSGELSLLSIEADGPRWDVVHSVPVGRGRLTLAPPRAGRGAVLYTTQDDGVVLRHEEVVGAASSSWRTELVFRGPLGPRGLQAGTFDADPLREQVLVFGYAGAVQLLTRGESAWRAETIFEDRAGGHWLSTIEIDSRNATDEIIGSGYGGRIFMLKRPPGYGVGGAAADGGEPQPLQPKPGEQASNEAQERAAASPEAARTVTPASRSSGGDAPVRSLFVAGATGTERLDPLRYRGGFQAKTALHETLVRRDGAGRIAPGLAAHWGWSADGRALTLGLRPGARWHSGAPVVAADVVAHFRRVLGLPEHTWLRGLDRVTEVSAPSENTVRFVLREPWDLLSDLCAINPCSVRGPGTVDREGEYKRPDGSAPWALRESDGARLVLDSRAEGVARTLELTSICPQPVLGVDTNAALDALRAGEVDVIVDGWYELVPRRSFATTAETGTAAASPGSSVWYVSFSLTGPTAARALRRALAEAIDRDALVREVEHGFGDPCEGWAAASVRGWPTAEAPTPLPASELATVTRHTSLRLVAIDSSEREAALAKALATQLRAAGFDVQLELLPSAAANTRIEAGTFDLRLERTWGVPYDPDLSLQARFLPPTEAPSAARVRDFGVDPALRDLVLQYASAYDAARRVGLATSIQRHIEHEATVIPLYAPQRLALARAATLMPALDIDLYRTSW